MAKSRNISRSALCDEIATELLRGRAITQNELKIICTQSGGHETSRILDVLRNKRGLPIKTTTGSYSTRCYRIEPGDRKKYHANPKAVTEQWRSEAVERALDRKLYRLGVTLGLLAKRRTGALKAIIERHTLFD